MYIPRTLAKKLQKASGKYPVIALVGPRQSGKTTLVKREFPDRRYVSLEDPDTHTFAQDDPRGFLVTYAKEGVIIDEAQRVPELFSYIQGIVDTQKRPGHFILTGSQNFLLHEKVSQSLAGRVAIFTLLPLSLEELADTEYLTNDYHDVVFSGMYPRLFDTPTLDPHEWHTNYIQTYIERDVRLLKHISNLGVFQHFVKLCAGRTGQLLNVSSLANDVGITHNTARSWIGVLEASFIVFQLQPYHKNFNKRLVKSPKLYFYDPGLAASLLGIATAPQLRTHHLKGELFESFIISELVKHRTNQGERSNVFFLRDKTGHEIDAIIENGDELTALEIKSGITVTDDFFKNLFYWQKLTASSQPASFVVYGGSEHQERKRGRAVGWKQVHKVLEA